MILKRKRLIFVPRIMKICVQKILNHIYKSQFIFDNPISVFLAMLTNSAFFVRKNLFRHIKYYAQKIDGRLLDFGCGAKPYERLFTNVSQYIGCDIEESGHNHNNEMIDVFYDGKNLPFESGSFDNIFSSQVFEHVRNLGCILKELNRVLKKGGGILITVPFVWNEHEVPYDFVRYTSYGIENILESNGFAMEELKKSTPYLETVFQMWVEYLTILFSKIPSHIIQSLLHFIFVFPSIIIGCFFSMIIPKDYSLYCDNIVFARKIKDLV